MYPFNATPGTRTSASTYGSPGDADFDDRDAQFLVGFDTSAQFTPGLGAANYQISSVKLTLTINLDQAFAYDPTADSYRTYLATTNPDYIADGDAGRAIELFGAGFRNGFTAQTFAEDSAFGPVSATSSKGVRNAYALGFVNGAAADVSNNVTNAFEATPFAIGVTSAVQPGALVPVNAEFTFTLNLADPDVVNYVRNALNAGMLDLIVTSLSPAARGGAASYPSFYTKENVFGDTRAARLDISALAVPEPQTWAAWIGGVAALLLTQFRRRRRQAQ